MIRMKGSVTLLRDQVVNLVKVAKLAIDLSVQGGGSGVHSLLIGRYRGLQRLSVGEANIGTKIG
jgi:hypothetical protein